LVVAELRRQSRQGGLRRLTRWWFRTPDGRAYRRRKTDAISSVAGLIVLAGCGLLVANRVMAGTETVILRSINHWPGWLNPLMWLVQLPGVIGALPLLAAGAAVLRRLRLAAALAAATLLKVSLEDVAKLFVQRSRPAETVPDIVLRGQAAAHGLSFPSGHAIVVAAAAVLITPYVARWWKAVPWVLAGLACVSRMYLGAHFPLDILAGAGLGAFIGGVLNLVFGVPGPSDSQHAAARRR
jgi:membrane-associated phospholipid phosphatase